MAKRLEMGVTVATFRVGDTIVQAGTPVVVEMRLFQWRIKIISGDHVGMVFNISYKDGIEAIDIVR